MKMGSFLPRHAERVLCKTNRPSAKAVALCQTNTHTYANSCMYSLDTQRNIITIEHTNNCTSISKSQTGFKKKLNKGNRRTSVRNIMKCVCVYPDPLKCQCAEGRGDLRHCSRMLGHCTISIPPRAHTLLQPRRVNKRQ